jgi:hypothetical protein
LGIIAAIAVPSYNGNIEKTEKEVCFANTIELERMYHAYLRLEGVDHSDARFNQYTQEFFGEICHLEEKFTIWMGMLAVVSILEIMVVRKMMAKVFLIYVEFILSV